MGKEGAKGLFGLRIGGFARTFAVYEDLCAISVRPHKYCLVVYLFLRHAGSHVDNFQKLESR